MSHGQLEALAVGAHKDTRELRRKHGQPSGLKLPAVHGGEGAEGGGGGRFGMRHPLKIP